VDLGDWWEVKIVEVDAYRRSVTVEAVRLIRKAGDGGS
jgi:ribosomal protein L24